MKALALIVMAGCSAGAGPSLHPSAAVLTGTWECRFTVDTLVRLRGRTESHTIVGVVAFVPNRWLNMHQPLVGVPDVYGAYDIDFSGLGLDPRDSGTIPTVYASMREDTVHIAMTDRAAQTLILVTAVQAGDSIVGRWVARSVGATASGHVRMTRELQER